jgi:UDP-glucose 4-epimerase
VNEIQTPGHGELRIPRGSLFYFSASIVCLVLFCSLLIPFIMSNTIRQQVLVTGGAGYIGSHTTVELLNAGYEVVVADDFSNSEPFILDRIRRITGRDFVFEQADLSDVAAVRGIFERHPGLCGVIHFAASKAVGDSVERPLHYYRNNLGSLINILECMRAGGLSSLVFSSSCTVYGQPDQLPVDETAPVKRAESPYGRTKQIGEDIIADAVRAYGDLKAVALRYFNPIGAHASALIGELPRGVPNNLIPFVTQTAYGLRDELRVFGDDYQTPDGSCIRDYLHVVDLALAHVLALRRLLEGRHELDYECFNLGTGRGVSVLEAIRTFEEVNGLKLPYRVVGRRTGDIEQVWADTRKANEVLGWKAQRSLADALQSAWKWEQAYRSEQS